MLYLNSLLSAALLSGMLICVLRLPVPTEAKILMAVLVAYLIAICIALGYISTRTTRTDRYLVGLVEHLEQKFKDDPESGIFTVIMKNLDAERRRFSVGRIALWCTFVTVNTAAFLYLWKALG